MRLRTCVIVLGLMAACGGSEGTQPRCSRNTDCVSGLVCLLPVAGEQGVCTSPPFGVGLVAPASGARAGKAGIDVAAQVTVANASAAGPDAVVILANGSRAGTLTLAGRDGALLDYRGTYVPPDGAVGSIVLAVAATISAGVIPSEGVAIFVDAKAPVLSSGATFCTATCLRDEIVPVTVEIEEDEIDTVEASLDLDGHAQWAPLHAVTPTLFAGELHLATYAFPSFSGTAAARFRARDRSGNETVLDIPAVPVTRVRWVHDAQALAVTAPAVAPDGSLVIAVNSSSAQLRAVGVDGVEKWRTSVGNQGIVQAPTMGAGMTWVGSNDGNLYGRFANGTLLTCPSSNQVPGSMFTPALRLAPEAAYSGGSAAKLYGANATGTCFGAGVSTTDAVTTSPVIVNDTLYVASVSSLGTASVRSFGLDLLAKAAVSPMDGSVACGRIDASPAANGTSLFVGCANGKIFAIDLSSLDATAIASLSGAVVESPVLLPNGDVIVGTNDKKLHRLAKPALGTGPWTEAWSPAPDLGAAVTGTLVASPDAAGAVVYAVTAAGNLYALDGEGKVVWSTAGESTPPLGRFSLSFPTIAPAQPGGLPTLYAGSAEGKLYAVVVDTGLDTTSPWPKSHHDVRNTGIAAAPLP
jgi:hypothetical protein